MPRRKRIPYDPPHQRAGRKGRSAGPPPKPEQRFMTRRMFLAKGTVVAAFATLAAKLGELQLVKGDEFKQQAAGNITDTEILKATRGVIYDRRGRELARNERTWQVRVQPRFLPEAGSPERARVLDHLINALNLPDALVFDPSRAPKHARPLVYARTAQLLRKTTLDVQETGETFDHPGLTVAGRVLRVNGQELRAFIYQNAATRRIDEAKFSGDRSTIAGAVVGWPAPPRLASAGNVLTVLLSADDRLAADVARSVAWLGEGSALEDLVATLRDTGWSRYIEDEERRNYLIRLEDDLSTDQAALCRAHLNELPGVSVMNRLEYLVENGRDQDEVVVRGNVPRAVALKLEANKLSLPGVELDAGALTRHYPGGEAMSHILGYVGGVAASDLSGEENRDEYGNSLYQPDDAIGKDGLELQMERLLRGHPGARIVAMGAAGGSWQEVPETRVEPIPGRNLALTIDLEFQRAVSEILREAVRFSNEDRRAIAARDPKRPMKKESGAGCVVAIDPRSGEVLTMVSYPHFDNQLFVDGISERKYQEYSSDEANRPLLDRALRGLYPAGSTLKTFLAAAALQDKKLDTRKTYTCTGSIMVPLSWDQSKGDTYVCWQRAGHNALDVYGAIEQSCDVFFYNVGAPRQQIPQSPDFLHYRDKNLATGQIGGEKHYFEGLGIEPINTFLERWFWFGKATGIDLPTEADGLVPDNDWLVKQKPGSGWSVGDTINVSIGQGDFQTTPLQLALNTAALANGGTIHKPQLVREEFDDARLRVRPATPEVRRRLDFRPDVLDVVKEGMRRVTHEPTGTAHRNPDGSSKWALTNPQGEVEILIAGKTGTAEDGNREEDGTYETQHAWFTAFAPLDEPEIAIAVIIEDGGEGSSYAVPVADRVLRAYFELTGKRPRGKVLRPEGMPAERDASVLAPDAAFPEPGANAAPGSEVVD